MIRVNWQDQVLDVRRLVFRAGDGLVALSRLAARLGLDMADDRASPRPGDFWIGCDPRDGWGNTDPVRTGWVSFVDVPFAVAALEAAVAVAEVPYSPETAELLPAAVCA